MEVQYKRFVELLVVNSSLSVPDAWAQAQKENGIVNARPSFWGYQLLKKPEIIRFKDALERKLQTLVPIISKQLIKEYE